MTVAKTAGSRLIAELTKPNDPYAVTILIAQAARHADRLENIHGVLSGSKRAWLQVNIRSEQVVDVHVDGLVQEERQQTTVLVRLLAQIHRQRGSTPPGDPDDDLAGL